MKQCIVCNHQNFDKLYNQTLLKCVHCGFVTANMEIAELEMQNIYTENYFKGEEYLDYQKDKKTIVKNFKRRILQILRFAPADKIKKAVEIGCAYGFFAQTLNDNVKGVDFTGFDIVPEPIHYGKNELKQNLICADYTSYHSENEQYTDVFMWDVIEHLPYPDKMLEKLSNETLPNGRIYITTGDIESYLARKQKDKWRMIHPPTHLHYFSVKTLTLLLKNNGFVVKSVSYPGIWRSINQIYYSLFLLNKKGNILSRFFYRLIPEGLGISINTKDIMFIIAEKQ